MTGQRSDSAGKPRPGTTDADVPPGSPLDYALRYAGLGWHVFPVHSIQNGRCTCHNAECDRPGKHPIRHLAPGGLKSATTGAGKIRAIWGSDQNAPWANIGVTTGKESGIWALDVDVADGRLGEDSLAVLEGKHGKIPGTVEALTGGGGRHLLFRWPEGRAIGNSTSALGPGLDIRGEGGYIVVEPSLHISGNGYLWEGSSEPFDPDVLQPAPAWLLTLVETQREQGAAPPMAEAGRVMTTSEKLELRSALAYLDADDYHTWIQVGMALHAATVAEGFALWVEWSQLSEKFDAKAMRGKWGSFRDSPTGVALPTIFGMAAKAGWVNPASRDAQAFERKYGTTFGELERQRAYEVVEDAPVVRTPLPVPELEAAANWITSAFPLTYPVATDHAVLALASLGAARIYTSPMGDPAHTYMGIAGRSVGELRYLRTALHQVLVDSGLRKLIRGTRFTSPQTIYQSLLRAPASLYATEEWGQMVAFAKRQPSGLIEQALNVLADAYEARSIYLDSVTDAGQKPGPGDDQPTIHAPSLSVLALLAMDQLEAIARRGEWGRGSLEQMSIALVPEQPGETRQPAGELKTPEWLSVHLCAVRRVNAPQGGNLAGIVSDNGQIKPNLIEVQWAASSRDHEQFLLQAIGQDDRRLLPLAYGGIKTLRRQAVALAAWADPQAPVVNRAIIDWLGAYIHRHLLNFVDRLSIVGSDDGKTSTHQKVIEALVNAGSRGLTNRNLIQQTWSFRSLTADKREELLEQLVRDGDIQEIETGDKRKRVLVASRFVQEKVRKC